MKNLSFLFLFIQLVSVFICYGIATGELENWERVKVKFFNYLNNNSKRPTTNWFFEHSEWQRKHNWIEMEYSKSTKL